MARTWNDPAGASTPNRADIIGKLNSHQDIKSTPVMESPASRWQTRHFDLSLRRARLIADLTGLGVTTLPILPTLMDGGAR